MAGSIMTVQPEVINQGDLLNRLVLNHDTMEELGRIEVLWMYPQAHRVLGFVCKSGFLGNRKLAFKLSQIEAIGDNGILTHSQPDATDADRVRQLESLIQCEVWSQAGTKLGKIIDCEFNLRTGVITDYLLVGDRLGGLTGGLAGTIHRLPPARIASFGRTRALVAATSVESFAIYREGLGQKLAHVTHTLKEEYSQVTEELKTLAKQAQENTQQTTIQVKTLAEQAREQAWEQAQRFAEQAKEKVQELNEQLNEQIAESLHEPLKEPFHQSSYEPFSGNRAHQEFQNTKDDQWLNEQLLHEIQSFNHDEGGHEAGETQAKESDRGKSRSVRQPLDRGDREWMDDDWFDGDDGRSRDDHDDDPWNITELPTSQTQVISLRVSESKGDPWMADQGEELSTTSPEIASHRSKSPRSHSKSLDPKPSDPKPPNPEIFDEEEEPWV
jgi:uncharacterized protein YrrD